MIATSGYGSTSPFSNLCYVSSSEFNSMNDERVLNFQNKIWRSTDIDDTL